MITVPAIIMTAHDHPYKTAFAILSNLTLYCWSLGLWNEAAIRAIYSITVWGGGGGGGSVGQCLLFADSFNEVPETFMTIMTLPQTCRVLQDPAEALSLWNEAAMRLQSAASLDVGDTAPLNALGDVHAGRAERLLVSQPAQVMHCTANA